MSNYNQGSEEFTRSMRNVSEDLEAYVSKRRHGKGTVRTHAVHDFSDKESRYQLTYHLRPWAKRALLN